MTREERVDWLCRLRCWVVAPSLMTAEQKSKFIEALTETIEAMQTEPCEDCISRQAAIDFCNQIVARDQDENDIVKAFGAMIFYLMGLPSVQPTQRTGKWIHHGDYDAIECSLCGAAFPDELSANYCPNCGAKMEAE